MTFSDILIDISIIFTGNIIYFQCQATTCLNHVSGRSTSANQLYNASINITAIYKYYLIDFH